MESLYTHEYLSRRSLRELKEICIEGGVRGYNYNTKKEIVSLVLIKQNEKKNRSR